MTYNGNIYFYVLNLQGDVMALLDVDGNEVVSYHYNAWGKLLNTTASTTGMLNSLAKYNPLRYRGYVYDRETGLYYLQSRYYNPGICRFINADTYLSTGQGVLSHNMFAYCYNNPVALRDPAGTIPFYDGFYDETYQQIGEWLGWRLKDAIDSFVTYMTNDSPDVVKSDLESKGVAAYKGSFVFRVDWLDTSAFSFGIIGIGSGNLDDPYFEKTLNHEYGHYVHFNQIGAVDYFFTTALPSLAGAYWAGKNEHIRKYYYSLPWENIAEQLGGVSRNYLPFATQISSAYHLFTQIFSQITLF